MLDGAYRQAKAFVLAVQFLTRFPTPHIFDVDAQDVDRSYAYYPAVGALLGGTYVFFALLIHIFYASSLLLAVLLAGLQIYLTGGLHVDGLMDTADGLLSYRSREQTLNIMKDSRVGAMGVMVFAVTLLVRIAVYQSLSLPSLISLLFITPFYSRSALLVLLRFTHPARTEGLGRQAVGKTNLSTIVLANGIVLLLVFALLHWIGLIGLIVASLLIIRFVRTCKRRIGGMTGDTFGAAIELLEVTLALVIALRP